MRNMSNSRLVCQSKGREDFDLAMHIAFGERGVRGPTAFGYTIPKPGVLCLLWYLGATPTDGQHPFPVPLNAEQAADMAWAWLIKQPDDLYQEYMDTDGSVEAEAWRITAGDEEVPFYVIAQIEPVWAIYHK